VSVSVSGFGYSNSGSVSGPGYRIATDAYGVTSVTGSGTLAGLNGGTATVSVNISRNLYWGFGSVSVYDPSAGINLTGYAFFSPVPYKFGNSSTVSGSWLLWVPNRGFVPYTITATVTDNA
jgi:hypothetical protein